MTLPIYSQIFVFWTYFLIPGYNLAISLAFIAIFKPSTAIDLNHILIFHFF